MKHVKHAHKQHLGVCIPSAETLTHIRTLLISTAPFDCTIQASCKRLIRFMAATTLMACGTLVNASQKEDDCNVYASRSERLSVFIRFQETELIDRDFFARSSPKLRFKKGDYPDWMKPESIDVKEDILKLTFCLPYMRNLKGTSITVGQAILPISGGTIIDTEPNAAGMRELTWRSTKALSIDWITPISAKVNLPTGDSAASAEIIFLNPTNSEPKASEILIQILQKTIGCRGTNFEIPENQKKTPVKVPVSINGGSTTVINGEFFDSYMCGPGYLLKLPIDQHKLIGRMPKVSIIIGDKLTHVSSVTQTSSAHFLQRLRRREIDDGTTDTFYEIDVFVVFPGWEANLPYLICSGQPEKIRCKRPPDY